MQPGGQPRALLAQDLKTGALLALLGARLPKLGTQPGALLIKAPHRRKQPWQDPATHSDTSGISLKISRSRAQIGRQGNRSRVGS
jgi:hypothetical protein